MKMANRKFTPEEIAEMNHNPFVNRVSESKISFTTEFKESFWKRARAGEPLAEIIRSFGLDPDVLGYRRIKGIYAHLNEQVVAGLAFTDKKRVRNPEAVLVSKPPSNREQQVKIRTLEHEVLYLKQELEFIKKIITADKEAELKCLLKRGRA